MTPGTPVQRSYHLSQARQVGAVIVSHDKSVNDFYLYSAVLIRSTSSFICMTINFTELQKYET